MTERFIINNNAEVSHTSATNAEINDIFGVGNWKTLPNPPADMEYPHWNNKIKKWENNDPRTYAEKRQVEYPSIADQLDMLYHDMVGETNEWVKTISAIKAKYPKE